MPWTTMKGATRHKGPARPMRTGLERSRRTLGGTVAQRPLRAASISTCKQHTRGGGTRDLREEVPLLPGTREGHGAARGARDGDGTSAVVNGLFALPLIVVILVVCNIRHVMGEYGTSR